MSVFWKKCVLITVLSLLLATFASAQSSITITNPANNETVVTPTMGVDASATSTSAMHVIQVYVDGAKATESLCNGANPCPIHTTIPITTGTNHRFTVQVLDNNSVALAKQTINLNATSTPVVLDNIDNNAMNWIACDQCGGGGGGNPVPASNTSSPSEDGNSLELTTFGETGITGGFGNSYWYVEEPKPTALISYIKYEFDLWVPSSFVNTPQALEFECQQSFGGLTYNFAWQALYRGSPQDRWRIFNYNGNPKAWQDSGLALTRFTAGSWHHIISEFHIDHGTNQIFHDALWVDGTRMNPTQNFIHSPRNTGFGNHLTNAFQIDMDSANDHLNVNIDKMKITYTQ